MCRGHIYRVGVATRWRTTRAQSLSPNKLGPRSSRCGCAIPVVETAVTRRAGVICGARTSSTEKCSRVTVPSSLTGGRSSSRPADSSLTAPSARGTLVLLCQAWVSPPSGLPAFRPSTSTPGSDPPSALRICRSALSTLHEWIVRPKLGLQPRQLLLQAGVLTVH